MRIKGIISDEIMRNPAVVYVSVELQTIEPAVVDSFSTNLQDDAALVTSILNIWNERQNFVLFAAMPAINVYPGDEVELICEIVRQFDDFFIVPNYVVVNHTHSDLYYDFYKQHFFEVLRDAAVQ